MRILYVEDEQELSDIVCAGLRKLSYAVDAAYDGQEALDYYRAYEYDVIVLDLNIPAVDGLEVLRQIRAGDGEAKILILSARSAVEDRVKGLDMGANDYLTKPFDFLELEARIRTLCRIAYVQTASVLTCGGLSVDMAAKSAAYGPVKIPLTKKEYAVVEYLMLHKGQAVDTKRLLEHAWDSEADLYPDTLKYHIHAIKKKLAEAGCDRELIRNVRGVGYRMGDEQG